MPIEVKELTHVYMKGTVSEVQAISNISFRIEDGEFVGLIGPTGSGKSTLIQHLNGLLKPTSGTVVVDGEDIFAARTKGNTLRQKVGLVFQYPEQQVFEETVYDDIAFGPRNLGLSEDTVRQRVEEARQMVGLDPEVLGRSPFELSGGQLRRVAIAGVVAMKPKVLVLDEPAAGLDPGGRNAILSRIKEMHNSGMTVILVSHNMEDVARLCQRLLVLNRGKLVADGTPAEIFRDPDFVASLGLKPPEVTELVHRLKQRGWSIDGSVLTVEQAYKEIVRCLRQGVN